MQKRISRKLAKKIHFGKMRDVPKIQTEKKALKIPAKLPRRTGVYQFLNSAGEIIYVGKAKDLRARVAQHFSEQNKSPRARKMREQTAKVDFLETENEVSALVLENNLIKKFQPKFNVLLRDDKTFIFIAVSRERFPQIFLTRRRKKIDAKFYGPKTSTSAAKKVLEILQKIFKFRPCRLDLQKVEKPCVEFQIGKCCAPCAGKILPEKYAEKIAGAEKVLRGQTAEILSDLKKKMARAAEEKNFERASEIRDQIFAIENFSQKVSTEIPQNLSADALGVFEKFGKVFVALLQIRAGKLIGAESFAIPAGENSAESLAAFLRIYRDFARPGNLFLPAKIFEKSEIELWEQFLKMKIATPSRGAKRILIETAEKKAENFAKKNAPKFLQKTDENLPEKIAAILNLKSPVRRVETFDISHSGGKHTVGAMAVFVDGAEKKSDFRHFKIRTLKSGEIDDPAAISEILRRRLLKLPKNLPDGFKFRAGKKADEKFIREKIAAEKLNDEDFEIRKFQILENSKNEIAGFVREKKVDENSSLLASLFVSEKFRDRKFSGFLADRVLSRSKFKKVYAIVFGRTKFVDFLLRLGGKIVKNPPQFLRDRVARARENHARKNLPTSFLLFPRRKVDRSFSANPDLILIDGGKPQLNAAAKVLGNLNLKIPVAAIAKKAEEIFLPGKSRPEKIFPDSAE